MTSTPSAPQEVREAMQPCPFCKYTPGPTLFRPVSASVAVVCNHCGAQGPLADSEEKAIAAWARAALSLSQRVAPISEPLETIEYWADAYTNPAKDDDHFYGHGMAAKLLREYAALRRALLAEAVQPSPAPKDSFTDEQLRALFTLEHGGPSPYYLCNECGESVPGLREMLVEHAAKHGAPKDGVKEDGK